VGGWLASIVRRSPVAGGGVEKDIPVYVINPPPVPEDTHAFIRFHM